MPEAPEPQDNSANEQANAAPPPAPERAPERPAPVPPAPAAVDREPLPEFDWLTEVAIPVCVFGLLGSLLYYLIEVRATLAGQYAVGPLRWVVFWFLLATIGIARIRTKYGGAAIAGYYSALLGLAMFVFVWVYTGRAGSFYGGANDSNLLALLFNWSLVGVIWWAASAVTREATLEENVETQLEGGLWTLLADEWQYPDPEDRAPAAEVDHSAARPRHPGRLVLWISLAALVLFAVGQRTIGGEGRHSAIAFWCMSAYLLFALLLMALTNLSALRMQVRRRGISLAPAVTPAWIIASVIVTLLIVVFSTQMPRSPTPEGHPQVVRLPDWLTDSHRPGVEHGPAQGLGPEGQGPHGEEQGAGEGERQGEGASERGQSGASTQGEEGDQGAGAEEGRSASSGGADQGEGEGESEGKGEESKPSTQGEQPAQPEAQQPPSSIPRLLLIVLLIAAAIATAFFAWLYRRQVRAALAYLATLPGLAGRALARGWHRFLRWLSRLGLRIRVRADTGNLPADPFVDIFAGGLADGLAPAEVVRYVYRAFQVYTARGGHGRREDQTALEFLRSLPPDLHLPDRAADRLTRAYVLATYSPREVTEAQVQGARATWLMMKERLETVGSVADEKSTR